MAATTAATFSYTDEQVNHVTSAIQTMRDAAEGYLDHVSFDMVDIWKKEAELNLQILDHWDGEVRF